MGAKKTVLCGASAYEQKYYFNKEFEKLPQSIQDELHIMCVLFTEEVGGVFTISFDEEGEVLLETEVSDSDIYYDEINSGLMIREVERNRQELFASLRLFYLTFVLKKDISEIIGEE